MAKRSLREAPELIGSEDWWLATGLGSGWLKPAPGTWGSLAGLLVALPVMIWRPGEIAAIALLLMALAATVIGARVIDRIEQQTGIHDAGEIVIDEWAGQWIALAPVAWFGVSGLGLIFAFALFRFFDIIKPWPIGPLDRRVSGGFGVMIDDVVAGLFTLPMIIIWEMYLS